MCSTVRLRKAEQEDHSGAVERARFNEDPKHIETELTDAVPSRVPSHRFPESIPNHQHCSELRCHREVPRPNQPVVDLRGEDGFSRGEVKIIDETSIGGVPK